MKDKILVDKKFLMRVLDQVDSLSKRVEYLEKTPLNVDIPLDAFSATYEKMVERNLKNLGINIIQKQ